MEELKIKRPLLPGCLLITTLFFGVLTIMTLLMYGSQNIYMFFNTRKFIPDTLTNIQFWDRKYKSRIYLTGKLKLNDIDVFMNLTNQKELFFKLENEETDNFEIPVWYFSKSRIYYRDSEVFDRSIFLKRALSSFLAGFIPTMILGFFWLRELRNEKKNLILLKKLRAEKRKNKNK